MVIILDFSDVNYANALASRMIEIKNNIDIKINTKCSIYDVYLSDHNYSNKDDRFIYLSHNIKDDLSIYSPCSQILNRINEIVGVTDVITGTNNCKIISFYSNEGGAGVSSISITFARKILLEGKKTIYITNTNIYYSGHTIENTKGYRMDYEIKVKHSFNIDNYLDKDLYSLEILKISNYENILEILNYLKEKKNYEYIIVDFSNCCREIFGDYIFKIHNSDDLRSNIKNIKENEYLLINNSMNMSSDEYDYSIPFDKYSFVLSKEYIDITLDGNIARNITPMIKLIENDK